MSCAKGLVVRYEGRVPTTLRRWCDAHPQMVSEVSAGYGYTVSESGFAYDIALRAGWRDAWTDPVAAIHTIIEPTVARALVCLRNVIQCDCEQCLNTLREGGAL